MERQKLKHSIQNYLNNVMDREESDQSFCAYIYDLKQLRIHTASLKRTLPAFCRLFYAVKANPDRKIISLLNEIVDGFEVASAGEIDALKMISAKPIIFGAPAKKEYEYRKIIEGEVEFSNIESLTDLRKLQDWAERHKKVCKVILRVNLKENVSESQLKMAGVPTQFGIDEHELPNIIAEAAASPNLSVIGFHFHAMSNNLDAQAHLAFIQICLEKALLWKEQFQLPVSIVNAGGGIGIPYTNPASPFDWSFLAEGLHHLDKQYQHEDIHLILELGRYMVAECGYYVAEVLDIKKNHGEYFALLRGGSHHFRLPAAWKMNHPFTIFPTKKWKYTFERPQLVDESVTLAGELCTPNDIFAKQEKVNHLRAGDLIVFHYAGAYGWTISHHDFLSHPQPTIYYCE